MVCLLQHAGHRRCMVTGVHGHVYCNGQCTGDAWSRASSTIVPCSAYCSTQGTGYCTAQSTAGDEAMGIVHGFARAYCNAQCTGCCIYAKHSNGDDVVDVHLPNLPALRWRIQNF